MNKRGSRLRHGMTGTPTHKTWAEMRQRCFNPNNDKYRYYGARGISVCERWLTFENFLEDMGIRPDSMTLDRIDNDSNYCPENCRWATHTEQTRNRKSFNVPITYQGKTACMSEIAEMVGMRPATLWARLNKGMSVEMAIETPLANKGWHNGMRSLNSNQRAGIV